MKIRIGRIALEFGWFDRVDKELIASLVRLEERKVIALEEKNNAVGKLINTLPDILSPLVAQFYPPTTPSE